MIQNSTISLIERFEGCRYKAYEDVIGKWTIGIGHLILPTENYLLSKTLSRQEVEDLLISDLRFAEKCISKNVLIKLSQNKFEALISFIFNLGVGNFEKSTLLKKVNQNLIGPEITAEFIKWNKAGGKEIKGLTLRRQAEADLYNTII